MKSLIAFLNSRTFETVTHRLGAYLLLLSNLVLPLGLHRPWMGINGWYYFPFAFSLVAIGGFHYVASHAPIWVALLWPFPILFTHDAWLLALVPVPARIDGIRRKGESQ